MYVSLLSALKLLSITNFLNFHRCHQQYQCNIFGNIGIDIFSHICHIMGKYIKYTDFYHINKY